MYKLVIEDDEGKTTNVPVVRDEITIGRKDGNTIRLTERNVSRQHARLYTEDKKVYIEDVASRYGTKFNGEKIKARRQFKEGDVVMIGDYRLSLQSEVKGKKPAKTGGVQVPSRPDKPAKSAGATQITAAAPAPGDIPANQAGRLVVISSNYAGREFPLTRPEMVIGRTEGDIRIDHRSISRNHAKIVRDGERYKIIDLRSSNGVRVNGEEYRSVHLKKGDVIELGHVRFRYVAAGESFTFRPETAAPVDLGPMPSSSPSGGGMGKVLVGVAGVVGLLVLLGVIAVVFVGIGDGDKGKDGGEDKPVAGKSDTTDPAGGKGAAPQNSGNEESRQFVEKAEKAISEERWEKALAFLDLALEKDPSNEKASAKRSLALREKGMKKFYDGGRSALDARDYQRAMENFSKIPADLSIYYKRIKDEGLLQKATDGFVASRLDEAEFAVSRREWRSARAILSEILKYDDDNERAKELLKSVNQRNSDARASNDGGKKNGGDDNKGPKSDPDKGKTNNPPAGNNTGTKPVKENKPPKPAESAKERREMAKTKLKEARQAVARGNHQQGIALANEAKRLGAGVGADIVLGQAYQKMGNSAAAVRHYNAWLRANGGSKMADSVRTKIQSLGGTPAN